MLEDRYLRLLALLVILVNVVNTSGEYLLGRLVAGQAAALVAQGAAGGLTTAQLIGRFYGEFFGWVNLGSPVVQLLLVSRIFRRIGVRGALFVLPAIACGSYVLFAFVPVLGAVRLGKIVENCTDYSLQNTARHALFLPTTAEAKYKAKQVIDGLCWRLGDIMQAGIVFGGTWLHFTTRGYALLNEAFVLAWFVVVWSIGREHRRRSVVARLEAAAA